MRSVSCVNHGMTAHHISALARSLFSIILTARKKKRNGPMRV